MTTLIFAAVRKLRRTKARSFRPMLESLEDRTLLAPVTWIGGSGDWNTGVNWSNGTGGLLI